ncbi:hypothetical protein NIES4074_49390 [Cylindrospermum sp. NIES-4074]|nr:hypothetical protein NIES4074_49390 [Cylindrospermum sp. NIES-4074]
MAEIWNALKNINYSGIPIAKILVIIVILTLTQALRRYSYASFQHSEKAKPVLEFFQKHKANLRIL